MTFNKGCILVVVFHFLLLPGISSSQNSHILLEKNDMLLIDPIAHGKSKFLGSAYSTSQAPDFSNYWNQITPENGGKWGTVEALRDQMNWNELDAAYNLAVEKDLVYKHHVLIWGNQQPAWMENLTPSEQLEEIKEWFQAVASRYPDIDVIEVVNEPIHDPPDSPGSGGGNYINALGGTGVTGYDWILEAFRLARQYFPDSELMMNEYSIVNSTSTTNTYIQIINLLRAENLIDQIGVQGHAFSTTGSTGTIESNLNLLAQTGLPIFVTELDIDGPTDAIQLASYQRLFSVFWEHDAVEGITLWGYRPGLWRNDQKAYLIEPDGVTERPALIWLRAFIKDTVVATEDEKKSPDIIKVYPNPLTAGRLSISGLERVDKIDVFNLIGEKLGVLYPKDNSFSIGHEMQSGLYILHVYADKNISVLKVIYQNI